ncbi:hypothetical protein [Fulvivirga ligni]|nr:hypothetical protein [Fulvivirga ligni]UII23895.1 hypothetical protein LVD16_11755 [Fulvivirga ligni]
MAVYAQPEPPVDDVDRVPIGGIEILLLAGGAFGLKKVLNNKKKSK